MISNADSYNIGSYFSSLNAIKTSSLNSLLNKLAGGELVSTGKNCFWTQVEDTNLLALVHYDDKNRKIVTQLDRIDNGHTNVEKDIGQHDVITYGGKTHNKRQKNIKSAGIKSNQKPDHKYKPTKHNSRSGSRSRSRSRSKSRSRSRSRSIDNLKKKSNSKKTTTKKKSINEYMY